MLDVLASPVGHLLAAIHSGLVAIGLGSGSGWAWGLSIIFLTMTVRLLLFPLFVKQIKSQRRMQQLAPKIKELQKAHKGDRETMNTEMMKLYKENNANPISGCLPLILQLPVFFALFSVIREFKPGASPRYGLSAQLLEEGGKAKVFGAPISAAFNSPADLLAQLDGGQVTVRVVAAVMVVMMGATTFWTQRQMIARSGTTDPQQVMVQKLLLYVLPLSFAVSGAFFPIGVLLYWLTTNVWSMGQQAWVIKRMPPVNFTPGVSLTKGSAGSGGKDGKDGAPAANGKRPSGAGSPGKGPGTGTEPAEGEPGSSSLAGTAGGQLSGGSGPKPKGAGTAGGGARDAVSANRKTAASDRTVAGVGGRSGASAGKSPQPGSRRAAGSRKNKNRRGGRR